MTRCEESTDEIVPLLDQSEIKEEELEEAKPSTIEKSKTVKAKKAKNHLTNLGGGALFGEKAKAATGDPQAKILIELGHKQYEQGRYRNVLEYCEEVYKTDAFRTDNLLLLGAVHFQLRNYSESIFFNQQAIRINPNFAEAYGNLGNALRELGDCKGAIHFYLKAIKLKPRFSDAYNNLACAYMQLGKSKQAIDTFKMALVLNPSLVDAHSNMGNLLKAQGKLAEAKKCYLEAIKISPNFAIAWSNLAGVFKDEGDLETAIAYYQEALRLAPEFADAQTNMGNALKEAGRIEEAKKAYNRAIQLRPDFAIAHGNLASVYYDEGNLEKAIATFKYAIQLEPNYPDAYNNLGIALRDIGEIDEAIKRYRMCLKIKADHPHAYNNLGNCLRDKGLVKEAVHCYMSACRLMPRFAAAQCNLANIMKEQGKFEQSIAHYHEAISTDPNFADAYCNLGCALKDVNQIDEAIKCFTTAIRLNQDSANAYYSLACAYRNAERYEDAITCFSKAISLKPDYPDALTNLAYCLLSICDWRDRDKHSTRIVETLGELEQRLKAKNKNALSDSLITSCIQPFYSLVFPRLSAKDISSIATAFARRAIQNVALLEMPAFRFKAKMPDEKLRIGYVSSNFGSHPISHSMLSLFGMHNKDKYEVYCYSLSGQDGTTNFQKIKQDAEYFRDISRMANGEAARQIYSDRIHILVDINGYTHGARTEIFALQPAPIQMSFQGFCSTMGASYIQYIIADETVITKNDESSFFEKFIFMPDTYMITDHKQSARDVLNPENCPTRSDYNLPEKKFVFANFNEGYKIDPEVFTSWCNILKKTPNSVLWLISYSGVAEANIRAEARARDLKESQIIFSKVEPREKHLKRAYLADLYLDTFTCSAQTTGADVLWSGTPIIARKGDKMSARVSSSLLNAVGLKQLVTETTESYEELAVSLATNIEKLWEVRRHLEESRLSCSLFDTQRYVYNLERAFEIAWQRHEVGQLPAHINVSEESV